VPEEPAQPIRDALSQLQMAYVRETQGGGEEPSEEEPAPEQPQEAADESERAKARAKIWTPPGS
jgi:hypothetical protein